MTPETMLARAEKFEELMDSGIKAAATVETRDGCHALLGYGIGMAKLAREMNLIGENTRVFWVQAYNAALTRRLRKLQQVNVRPVNIG